MESRDLKLVEKIDKKYLVYQENIINKDLNYFGLKLTPKRYPEIDGKCGTFFHMITKGKEIVPCKEGKCKYNCKDMYQYNPLLNTQEPRMICQKRLDYIELLRDFDANNLKAYEKMVTTPKGKKHRVILINEEKSYIYVLEHHKTYVLLWTGYDIPKWKLKKELNNYNIYTQTGEIIQ